MVQEHIFPATPVSGHLRVEMRKCRNGHVKQQTLKTWGLSLFSELNIRMVIRLFGYYSQSPAIVWETLGTTKLVNGV